MVPGRNILYCWEILTPRLVKVGIDGIVVGKFGVDFGVNLV